MQIRPPYSMCKAGQKSYSALKWAALTSEKRGIQGRLDITAKHAKTANVDSLLPWSATPTTMHGDLSEEADREEGPAIDKRPRGRHAPSVSNSAPLGRTSHGAKTPEMTANVVVHQIANEVDYGKGYKEGKSPAVPNDMVWNSLPRESASSRDSGRHTSRMAPAAQIREMLHDPLHSAPGGYNRCTNPSCLHLSLGPSCKGSGKRVLPSGAATAIATSDLTLESNG
jgi:hypothetical protein